MQNIEEIVIRKNKVRNSSYWTLASYSSSQIIRFVSNIIMTRILFEEIFGLMAIANVFILGLTLFSDLGLGVNIIQNDNGDDPDFLNSAWTIQVIRGLCIYTIIAVLTKPFANFYEEEILSRILPIIGINALFEGLVSTSIYTSLKHLELKKIAILEFISQLSGVLCMLVWGLVSPTIWALVAGSLVTSCSKLVLSHYFLSGFRNTFRWKNSYVHEIFRFGKWIFVSTIIAFLAQQSDRLIIGKMIPMGLLGIYHIGYTLCTIPQLLLAKISASIFLPLFSSIKNSSSLYIRSIFKDSRRIILITAGWAFSGLIAGGSIIVSILYDDRYLKAGHVVQLISAGFWFSAAMDTYGALLLANGRSGILAFVNFSKFAFMLPMIIFGNRLFGFSGALLGIVFAELLRLMVAAYYVKKLGFGALIQDLWFAVFTTISSSIGLILVYQMKRFGLEIYIQVFLLLFTITLFWLPLFLRSIKKLKASDII